MSVLLKNGSIFRNGAFAVSDAAIVDGIISAVGQPVSPDGFDYVFDCANTYVIPGLADVHVHLRQPGFSYKETIASGTAAAAHGGYTEVCSMPNLDPCPDSVPHLNEQLDIIRRDARVTVRPYGAITAGENGTELSRMEELAPYVCAFSDDGKGVQDCEMMRQAMLKARSLGKAIAAHCEDNSLLRGGYIHDGAYAAAHGHRGICSESEWGPIQRDIGLVRETGCRYHVCHVSTAESVELIRQAKAEGLPVTCETAPHYLLLCDEDITADDGRFKMNPPLRSPRDRDALIQGIIDGTVDVIATDHAPHSAEEKNRGLEKSPFGIVGLETAFDVLYEKLVLGGIIPLERLVELMAVNPRGLFNPDFRAGDLLAGGSPADLTIIQPLAEGRSIDPDSFLSMGRSTPFAGWKAHTSVRMTVCGGKIAYRADDFLPAEGTRNEA